MEPQKKHPIEKENHLNNPHPCIFQGVSIPINYPCIAKGSFWSSMTLETKNLNFPIYIWYLQLNAPIGVHPHPQDLVLAHELLGCRLVGICQGIPSLREYLWIWGMPWYPVTLGVLAGPNLWTWLLWTQTQKQGVHYVRWSYTSSTLGYLNRTSMYTYKYMIMYVYIYSICSFILYRCFLLNQYMTIWVHVFACVRQNCTFTCFGKSSLPGAIKTSLHKLALNSQRFSTARCPAPRTFCFTPSAPYSTCSNQIQ